MRFSKLKGETQQLLFSSLDSFINNNENQKMKSVFK